MEEVNFNLAGQGVVDKEVDLSKGLPVKGFPVERLAVDRDVLRRV